MRVSGEQVVLGCAPYGAYLDAFQTLGTVPLAHEIEEY
jgi:hypothetical protein